MVNYASSYWNIGKTFVLFFLLQVTASWWNYRWKTESDTKRRNICSLLLPLDRDLQFRYLRDKKKEVFLYENTLNF
jgi:hypothetical protein